MTDVVNCATDPALPHMEVVFLVLLVCSFIVYALVAFHSVVNTTPLFAEQWKSVRNSVSEWRQSTGHRGSVSQARGGVSPITLLCLQLITVATMLRLCYLTALVVMSGIGVEVPCGSFMELPSTVSWLMMLHDLGTLLLVAVLGGFCFFWQEFERIVSSSASIPRLIIDQWSDWSIAFCVALTVVVIVADVLYGFFKGTQLTLLHMARELLLGYLAIYYGSRMLVLGSAVIRSTQSVVTTAALKTRYLQRAGFGCTLVMGFLRVANAILILVEPSWITDFNIMAFAAYTAAEVAFIVSVDAIVQPSHLKDLHITRARSSAGSLSAHRITQSFSSFVLGRIDSPKDSDSSRALSMDRRQFEQMHGRKSSFSSAPPTPMRSPSETSPRPPSLLDAKAAAVEMMLEKPIDRGSTPSDDGTDVEEVVPFDGNGEIALTVTVRPSIGAPEEETKEALPEEESTAAVADLDDVSDSV